MAALQTLLVLAAQLAAGFLGGFLGGFAAALLRVAPGAADWVVVACILLTFAALGALLGRWRAGPERRDAALGCGLYVVVNVLLDVVETGGARLALRVILGGLGALLFYGAALWSLRRRAAAQLNQV